MTTIGQGARWQFSLQLLLEVLPGVIVSGVWSIYGSDKDLAAGHINCPTLSPRNDI